MTQITGKITNIFLEDNGSTLSVAALSTDTVLHVEDSFDFESTGGTLEIEGNQYGYTSVDYDQDTITLSSAIGVALSQDSQVQTFPLGSTRWAQIDLGDDDEGIQASTGVFSNQLSDGIRAEEDQETVICDDALGGWTIIQLGEVYAFEVELENPDGTTEPGTLQDIYDAANAAAAAALDAAMNATTALAAANGKNKTIVSLSSPGSTPNAAGDIWFRKESATQTVIEQWEGLGGTSWQQVTLNNQVIANLDAGKIVAGSAFINAVWVKTNFTLGDAAVNGVIQSYNFAGSSVGVYIDKYGLVAKGGSLSSATITSSSITATTITNNKVYISNDDVKCYSDNSNSGDVATLSGSVKYLGAGAGGGFRPGIAMYDSSAFSARVLYNDAGTAVMDGNFRVDGTLETGGGAVDTNGGAIYTNGGQLYLASGDISGLGTLTFSSWGVVSRQAADSAGTGFRALRVPN